MTDLLISNDSAAPCGAARRYWWRADAPQVYVRMMALEGELSVAMALLKRREDEAEMRDGYRSAIVADLMAKWRALLDAQPGDPT